MASEPLTYAQAGVDTHAGDRAVALMKEAVGNTHGANVVTGVGGFAGLIDVSELRHYRRPLLACATDGVGTKIAIAQQLNIHDTIGQDLVGMVVDDIVVSGARTLAMTDYIACGKVIPERIAAIVRGIAEGCSMAGVALVGGETAEHPGLMEADEYDVAGAAVGVVEADRMLGPDRVRDTDVLLGVASSGLHSNGYSLVRAVIAAQGMSLETHVEDFGRSLGEELLEPTRIYSACMLDLLATLGVENLHALSHVTGGGLHANLARVIPAHLAARVDRSSWSPAPIFDAVRAWGDVPLLELESTLNMGVGMVAVLSPDALDEARTLVRASGFDAWVIGEVMRREDLPAAQDSTDVIVQGAKGVEGGGVFVTGLHPGWTA